MVTFRHQHPEWDQNPWFLPWPFHIGVSPPLVSNTTPSKAVLQSLAPWVRIWITNVKIVRWGSQNVEKRRHKIRADWGRRLIDFLSVCLTPRFLLSRRWRDFVSFERFLPLFFPWQLPPSPSIRAHHIVKIILFDSLKFLLFCFTNNLDSKSLGIRSFNAKIYEVLEKEQNKTYPWHLCVRLFLSFFFYNTRWWLHCS